MLSIHAMSSGRLEYYLEQSELDYYVNGGEPEGIWLGRGAVALGLSGTVDKEQVRNLFKGLSPNGTEALVQNAGSGRHRPGVDLTFSAPKSVSAIWSVADYDLRREIQEAQLSAVKAAIKYLEETAAFTRRGKGGVEKEKVTGLVVVGFEHCRSREDDQQLHLHGVVLNVAPRLDGTTGTIVSHDLYLHKMAAGAIYRAEFAKQLEDRCGLIIERDGTSFQMAGVPKAFYSAISTRRGQILQALHSMGQESARAAAAAALMTRRKKEDISRPELFAKWQERGRTFGFGAEQADELLWKQPARHDLAARVSDAISVAIQRIINQQSHFSERDLVRWTAVEAQGKGLSSDVVIHAVRQELTHSPEIVQLGGALGKERYTTWEMMALEAKLLSAAEASRANCSHVLRQQTVEEVIARRPTITAEQAEAVRHVTLVNGSIQIITGMAGTGKTYTLDAVREAYEVEGYTVIGAALAGKAADGLQEGAKIRSHTLAKLLGMPQVGYKGDFDKSPVDELKHHAMQIGRAAVKKSTWTNETVTLDEKTVIVIDEAGMVGTKMLQKLVDKVCQAGARLILVGDAGQLQPIEAGGPFNSLAKRLGEAKLTQITRQREEWARAAVKAIAYGQADRAIQAFAERGLVAVAENREEAMVAMIDEWKKNALVIPKDHLLLAASNLDVGILNQMAQAERKTAGLLGPVGIELNSCTLYRGDRALCASPHQLVRNGQVGTVLHVDQIHQAVTLKLDNGKLVTLLASEYGEHLRLGYAVTTHKAQGMTVENSYILAGGEQQDLHLTYVQASRARETTRIYTDKFEAGEELTELCRQMSTSHQKDLAHDVLHKQDRAPSLDLDLRN